MKAKRVFEILRLSVINENDKQQMKQFRLAVKRRLNQPYAVSTTPCALAGIESGTLVVFCCCLDIRLMSL